MQAQGLRGPLAQRLAIAVLTAWADMSSSARHKLTGLGLHKAVAAIATSAGSAGEGGQNAIELQWEILRCGCHILMGVSKSR